MKKIFTRNQLALIENAFETGRGVYKYQAGEVAAEKAFLFGSKFVDEDKRMIAIMQNIIDNKGTFKP